MSSFAPKQYGLILKKPAGNALQAAKKPSLASVFDDDDDDGGGQPAGQSQLSKASQHLMLTRKQLILKLFVF